MEKNSIPLYLQLEQVIKSKILMGEYMPGDQIPTEKDLCSTYEISSVTARQAILNLVNEGLLIRKQGKGTFVTEVLRERQNIKTLHLMGDINDIIPEGLIGKKVDVLDIIRIKPPKKVAKIFDMDSDSDIIRVRRTRNDDKTPDTYIVNYLPLEIGERINKSDLHRNPMLHVLSKKLGIKITGGTQYIGAMVADYDIASALQVNVSSPILNLETLIYGKDNIPIDYAQTFYKPDHFRIHVKLLFN